MYLYLRMMYKDKTCTMVSVCYHGSCTLVFSTNRWYHCCDIILNWMSWKTMTWLTTSLFTYDTHWWQFMQVWWLLLQEGWTCGTEEDTATDLLYRIHQKDRPTWSRPLRVWAAYIHFKSKCLHGTWQQLSEKPNVFHAQHKIHPRCVHNRWQLVCLHSTADNDDMLYHKDHI